MREVLSASLIPCVLVRPACAKHWPTIGCACLEERGSAVGGRVGRRVHSIAGSWFGFPAQLTQAQAFDPSGTVNRHQTYLGTIKD